MFGKGGIILRVDEEGLAKVVRDLSIAELVNTEGVNVNIRHVMMSSPSRYEVRLSKGQRKTLEARLTVTSLRDTYCC